MTNSSPAFSVIIPCYNAEAYIGALLDSLIATRYPALKILCLDDLSRDHTRDDNYIRYCATVLNWHITGKFSKTGAYRTYYNRVRAFMQAHRAILTSDKNFRRIIKRPYWFMRLSHRIRRSQS